MDGLVGAVCKRSEAAGSRKRCWSGKIMCLDVIINDDSPSADALYSHLRTASFQTLMSAKSLGKNLRPADLPSLYNLANKSN